MKNALLPALLALVIPLFTLSAAEPAAKANPKAQLQELVEKIKTKLAAGQATEKDLAPELKQFDDLLTEHKGEKTDDVAMILMIKASLYAEVMDDMDKAMALIKQLKKDFPETKLGMNADKVLESLAKQAEAKKIQKNLVPGAQFPDFKEKDLDGKPLSVSGLKGKIVLVDFWATWCGPCVGELPNVLAAYTKYHDKGFEIIGISLDQDKSRLTQFLKEQKIPWAQYFDGKGWENKLAAQYGINSIPATYLLDKDGKIIATDLRGPALEEALAKAIEK